MLFMTLLSQILIFQLLQKTYIFIQGSGFTSKLQAKVAKTLKKKKEVQNDLKWLVGAQACCAHTWAYANIATLFCCLRLAPRTPCAKLACCVCAWDHTRHPHTSRVRKGIIKMNVKTSTAKRKEFKENSSSVSRGNKKLM